MERGVKKVSEMRPIDDTKDKQLIERIIDKHDYEPMDAKKLKTFIEEKRHKIKRPTKKLTKNDENQINKVNKPATDMNFRFKSDDSDEEINPQIKSQIKSKTSIKKPTKVNVKIDSDNESEEEIKANKPMKANVKTVQKDDSDDDSDEEERKPKTSIKKPKNKVQKEKVNDKSESEESLSKIQLLNQELFKENSNKSRNEDIKNAWKSLSKYELPDKDNLIIKKSHPGHFVAQGWCSGSLRNPHWLVMNKTGEEYYIMNCTNDIYTKFSIEDYKDVINPEKNIYPSWTKCKNGYIDTHSYITSGNRIYLHQVICKKHNEKKYATLSVDHKNRDKLDNRKENLRFATQTEQNQNTDKRNRKYNAKKLPDGLKQEDMPKYVLYYSEMYGTNKDKFREWLNIEKHPKQNGKRWSTSKSMGVSIHEKLEQAKAKLEELNL